MNKDPFEEYIKDAQPNKREKAYAWSTAIGLQAVDGLTTSEYLRSLAVKNIEGEISIKEATDLLSEYYEINSKRVTHNSTEDADIISARIAALLSEPSFSFTPHEYLSIHRKIFENIYEHAGHMRDYNITKKERVLDGATIHYGSASELKATLDYDFNQEKNFSYKNLSVDEIIDFQKPDIGKNFKPKTAEHVKKLYSAFCVGEIFGRADVMKVIGIRSSGASELIKKMLTAGIIEPVKGYGKGKYRLV